MKYIAYMITDDNPRPRMLFVADYDDRRELISVIEDKINKTRGWYIRSKDWISAEEPPIRTAPAFVDDRIGIEISQACYGDNPFNPAEASDIVSRTAMIYIDTVAEFTPDNRENKEVKNG